MSYSMTMCISMGRQERNRQRMYSWKNETCRSSLPLASKLTSSIYSLFMDYYTAIRLINIASSPSLRFRSTERMLGLNLTLLQAVLRIRILMDLHQSKKPTVLRQRPQATVPSIVYLVYLCIMYVYLRGPVFCSVDRQTSRRYPNCQLWGIFCIVCRFN
jgi:hypothetical protein